MAFGFIALLAGCAQLPMPPDAGSHAQLPDDIEIDVEPDIIPEPEEDPTLEKLYEWNGSGRPISRVVIDTNAQRARFYDGQEQVGWTTIASGVSAHPTPRGEFEVIEKVTKKRSNLYGRIYDASGGLHKRNAHSSDPIPEGGKFVGARMPYFMRMTYDGIGMHAGAIPQPGQPASHGCIRLPDEVASSLFAHADIGTRVTVIGSGPDYGDYAERIRRQREQERRNRVAKAETSSDRGS
ncbi:MAG: L,D-transpeptidase, partial [Halochromatium sp.]